MKGNLTSRHKIYKKPIEFSRRDFIKKIGNGTALAVAGGNFSSSRIRKESKKDAARKAAMNSFRKGLKVYEYVNFHKSLPNGREDVPKVMDKWAEAGLDFLITTGKLFNKGEVTLIDHYEDGNSSKANLYIANKFEDRMDREHVGVNVEYTNNKGVYKVRLVR